MGQYNQAVITTAGQGLLAGVIASGKALAFTNAKTSTHIYPSGLEALTDITDVMQTDAVSSATVMSNTQVKISTRFTNEGITAAYDINTIGIFAKAEGDTTDTLFAVITAVTPDAMPKYTTTNPVAYIYDITVGMSNADSITLNVSPTGTPSYGDLAAAQTAAENASAANLAPAYDSTATYTKDDFCVNGGKLYQCNADISTAEAFNPAHWTEVKVTEVMGGGGGVTPEIMAQIENAQWKTEGTEQLFSETVNLPDSSYFEYSADSIPTDTIKVIYDGTEYTCVCHEGVGTTTWCGAPFDPEAEELDYSEYPFVLYFSLTGDGKKVRVDVKGETPGTHTISAIVDAVSYTESFKSAVKDLSPIKYVKDSPDAVGGVIEGNVDSNKVTMLFAHAEGTYTTASGDSSHAEGTRTTASGDFSHAEGNMTTASGGTSHAEGGGTTASGSYSHAEGNNTTASGHYSHAEGRGTIASKECQHVFGKYNQEDTTTSASGTFVEIVGNGTTASKRKNARTLDWSGNESLAGSLTLGMGTADAVTVTPAQLKALIALLNT